MNIDGLDAIDNNGIFLLNTNKDKIQILKYLTNYDKNIIKKKIGKTLPF